MTDDITRAYDAFRAEYVTNASGSFGERWHRVYSALEALPTDTLRAFIEIADEHEVVGHLLCTFPRFILEARAEAKACRNCKHWKPLPLNDERYYYLPTVPYRDGVGVCDKAKRPDRNEVQSGRADPFGGALMFVQDAEDYSALLVTKAEFFCAHFEAKP